MTWFIDRRLNGKNKSTVNRQRFLRRYKAQIKQSISEAINKRSVTDVDSGESVSIPTDDISEPMFHQGRGGLRHRVHQVMTTSFRTTESSVHKAVAVVQEAVRDRPARTVKVRMSLSSRSQKMNISTCSLKIWRCQI
jgi:uncharacterized sporulation protein YeaH/YhbH (DUF444 family)